MKLQIMVVLALLIAVSPMVFAAPSLAGFGYDCSGSFGYGYSCSETHHTASKTLTIEVSPSCDANVVTVTSGGDALAGAHVAVIDTSPIGGVIFSGDTNSDGIITFPGCGMLVNVYSSKSGYLPESVEQQLISCGQCTPGGCTADSQCADNQRCSNEACVAVDCSCGTVRGHTCSNYECCSDNQCSGGKVCTDHSCKEKPTTGGGTCTAPTCCTADAQCAGSQNCLTVTGAPASANSKGQCHDISGCGAVENHQLVPYQCGTGPNCPSCSQGQVCANNKCVGTSLNAPGTGSVGGSITILVLQGDGPCANCEVQITDPSGKVVILTTDADGHVVLPLTMQGAYTIALIKDGKVVNSVKVNANPAAAPPSGNKTGTTGTGQGGGDLFSMVWIIGLVLVIVVGIYFFARGKPK
jgi:hypothetical protein